MFEILRSVLNERVRYLFGWNGVHRCLNTTQFGTPEEELLVKQKAVERCYEWR